MNLLFVRLRELLRSQLGADHSEETKEEASNRTCFVDFSPADPRFQHVFEVLNAADDDSLRVAVLNGRQGPARVEWLRVDSEEVESPSDSLKQLRFPLHCHAAGHNARGESTIPFCLQDAKTLACRRAGPQYGRREHGFVLQDFAEANRGAFEALGVKFQTGAGGVNFHTGADGVKVQTGVDGVDFQTGADGFPSISSSSSSPSLKKGSHERSAGDRRLLEVRCFLRGLRLHLEFEAATLLHPGHEPEEVADSGDSCPLNYQLYKWPAPPRDSAVRRRLFLDPPFDESAPALDVILACPRPKALDRLIATLATLGVRRLFLVSAEKVEPAFFDATRVGPKNIGESVLEGLAQAAAHTFAPLVRVCLRLPLEEVVQGVLGDARGAEVQDHLKLVAHPYGSRKLSQILRESIRGDSSGLQRGLLKKPSRATLAIGPEGGWSEAEMDTLGGFARVSLGPRILKTYDAAVALLTLVREELDDE